MSAPPQGWTYATIEQLAGARGLTTDGDWIETKDQDPDGDVRLIQLADIGDGEFRNRSARFVTTKTAHRLNCTLLEKNDLLIARMPDPLGRACVFPGVGQSAITAVDVFVWRPSPGGPSARWLMHFVNSRDVRTKISEQAGGTTRQRIAGGRVKQLELPVPPLREQRRIVAKIDSLYAKSTRVRIQLNHANQLVQKYKRSILAAAFRGDLTKGWRGQNPSVGPWRDAILKDIADIQSGIALGKKRNGTPHLIKRPYLRVANVQRGWLELEEIKEIEVTDQEASRLYLCPGDILMNEGGDRDKLGRGWVWEGQIENCIHQNHVFRVRLHDPTFPPKLISLYANEFGQVHFFDEASQTTNLASISKTRLSTLPLRLPSPSEGVEILRRIETAFAWIDRLASEATNARKLMDHLDQAILAKAFQGELVPQDPSDEPASVLLDRIRTDHAEASAKLSKRTRSQKR